MGQHYVNGDAGRATRSWIHAHPEAVMYEPQAGRQLQRLVGVEWVVFKDEWDAGQRGVPTLFGKPLTLVQSPNRYGIPAFYQIHAWIWKHNPGGEFSDWNPTVVLPRQRAELARPPRHDRRHSKIQVAPIRCAT